MSLQPATIAAWREWIGRREIRRQRLDVESLRRFAAATGEDLDVERIRPALGHWAYFLETSATSALGPDGHPLRGAGVLPPISLPRRMFASAVIRLETPLDLDQEAELVLTIADLTARAGKSGDLVFVEIDRVLTQHGRTRVSERQTLVYRDVGPPMETVASTNAPSGPEDVVWTPGSADLFRFSAATFNTHRIHYDQPYAREDEGYPDLVVHGPLTAAKLAALAVARRPGRPLSSFGFRASAPLFVDQPVRLGPGEQPDEWFARRSDGMIAMSATAGFAPVSP